MVVQGPSSQQDPLNCSLAAQVLLPVVVVDSLDLRTNRADHLRTDHLSEELALGDLRTNSVVAAVVVQMDLTVAAVVVQMDLTAEAVVVQMDSTVVAVVVVVQMDSTVEAVVVVAQMDSTVVVEVEIVAQMGFRLERVGHLKQTGFRCSPGHLRRDFLAQEVPRFGTETLVSRMSH